MKTDGSFAALVLTYFLLRMQANKAISRNGAVLGGSIMVGVTACTEAGVMIILLIIMIYLSAKQTCKS